MVGPRRNDHHFGGGDQSRKSRGLSGTMTESGGKERENGERRRARKRRDGIAKPYLLLAGLGLIELSVRTCEVCRKVNKQGEGDRAQTKHSDYLVAEGGLRKQQQR